MKIKRKANSKFLVPTWTPTSSPLDLKQMWVSGGSRATDTKSCDETDPLTLPILCDFVAYHQTGEVDRWRMAARERKACYFQGLAYPATAATENKCEC
jgi:hypothetical protein